VANPKGSVPKQHGVAALARKKMSIHNQVIYRKTPSDEKEQGREHLARPLHQHTQVWHAHRRWPPEIASPTGKFGCFTSTLNSGR